MVESGRRDSQVTLKTVFTVSFGVLAVCALALFLLRTQTATMLALGAAMTAVAMNHAVEALTTRRVPRKLAVPIVIVALLGIAVGLGFTLIPPAVAQAKAFVAAAPSLFQKLRHTRAFEALDTRFDLDAQLRQATG